MSPEYPQSEPSPEPQLGDQQTHSYITPPTSNAGGCHPGTTPHRRTPSTPSSTGHQASPPLTPSQQQHSTLVQQLQASTMMGQLMGALNNSTILDDLNLNIETLHGGFDCNVDEVIKHELSMEGSLDFNFMTSSQQLPPSIEMGQGQGVVMGGAGNNGSLQQTLNVGTQSQPVVTTSVAYSSPSSVTPPSWVH